MSYTGVDRRLSRVLPARGSVVLPLDGALIDGPTGGLLDLSSFLTNNLLAEVSSILSFPGLLKSQGALLSGCAFIANVSASTVVGSPTQKVCVSSVQRAARLGADAVCFQIHLSDNAEPAMLIALGKVVDQASELGMPVLVTAYPRRSMNGVVDSYERLRRDDFGAYVRLVSHTVRVAAEMGADAIKTVYTGDTESFETVVSAAMGVPLLAAGGPRVSDRDAVTNAQGAIKAGAWGVAYGRQIFENRHPAEMARRLRLAMLQVMVDDTISRGP